MGVPTFEDGRNCSYLLPINCRATITCFHKVGSNLNHKLKWNKVPASHGSRCVASEEFDAVLDVVIERRHSHEIREAPVSGAILNAPKVFRNTDQQLKAILPLKFEEKWFPAPKAVEKVPQFAGTAKYPTV